MLRQLRENDSVYTFSNRCRIEHWFPAAGDALDLSMEDWGERLIEIIDIERWKSGDDFDPLKQLLSQV